MSEEGCWFRIPPMSSTEPLGGKICRVTVDIGTTGVLLNNTSYFDRWDGHTNKEESKMQVKCGDTAMLPLQA